MVLVDSHPEIWRQLEVRGSTSLGQVHVVLQVAFGWEDAHLHRFTDRDPFAPLRPIDGELPEALQWLPTQWCEEPGDSAEEDCSLDQVLAGGSGMAFYEYDFGDSWLHRIELISRRPATKTNPPARLIAAGARRGPLEDSGGMPGFEEILDALADPAHPEHGEHKAWVTEMAGTDEPFDQRGPCPVAITSRSDPDRLTVTRSRPPRRQTSATQPATPGGACPAPSRVRRADALTGWRGRSWPKPARAARRVRARGQPAGKGPPPAAADRTSRTFWSRAEDGN